MKWLWDLIVSGVSALVETAKKLHSHGLLYLFPVFGLLFFFFTVSVRVAEWVIATVVAIVEKVTTLFSTASEAETIAGQGAVVQGWIDLWNTFVPLSEWIVMLAVLTTVYLLAAIIRMIKGWIPTMGG